MSGNGWLAGCGTTLGALLAWVYVLDWLDDRRERRRDCGENCG